MPVADFRLAAPVHATLTRPLLPTRAAQLHRPKLASLLGVLAAARCAALQCWVPDAPTRAAAAGTDGGMSVLAPLDERAFRRLFSLQTALATSLPHVAGLNPRAFR